MIDRTLRWVTLTALLAGVNTPLLRYLGWQVWLPIVLTQIAAYYVGRCDGIETERERVVELVTDAGERIQALMDRARANREEDQ